MLSIISAKASFVARVLASYIPLLINPLYRVFVSIILRLIGHPTIGQWATARCFKYVMALMTGITFEIEDPKGHLSNVRRGVFIANHQTEPDMLMLGHAFPLNCTMTAKPLD